MLPEIPGTHYPVGLVGLEAGLDGKKKFAPTEIRSADRLIRSKTLYQLPYPGLPWPRYLLTPWSRVLLEKLTVNFAANQEILRIYGTRKFLTVPTSARHLSLS
jgi:hypothetical protein